MWDALDTLVDNGLSQGGLVTVIHDLLISDETEEEDTRCLVALAWYADQGNVVCPADVEFERGEIIKIDGISYRVLTEDEKEDAWDAALDSYGDECVPGYSGSYFNREKWKKDARMDGAGMHLSNDGHEWEFCVVRPDANSWWFLYRV